jgi:hypothetical protein
MIFNWKNFKCLNSSLVKTYWRSIWWDTTSWGHTSANGPVVTPSLSLNTNLNIILIITRKKNNCLAIGPDVNLGLPKRSRKTFIINLWLLKLYNSYVSQKRLKHHKIKHTGEHLICGWPQCGKKFALKTTLENHLKLHENPLRCDWPGCEKTFTLNSSFKYHIRSHQKHLNNVITWDNYNLFYFKI